MELTLSVDPMSIPGDQTCAECCTYIPDHSEEITDLIQKIRTEGAKYHDYNPDDLGLVMWLSSTFGTWGSFLGSIILPIVGVPIV